MRKVLSLDRRTFFGAAAATVAAAINLLLAIPVAAGPSDAPFVAQISAAMTKMMAAMMIKPSGNVDEDFVASMVPHHQGAIEMAEAELRYGHNETIRRIAQEIIVTQQQEIAAMRLALGEPLPPSAPAPDQTP
jgi:deoxyhypusine synthase